MSNCEEYKLNASSQEQRSSLGSTLWKALSLDGNFYENARDTPQTHRIALTIVMLAALSHMVGSTIILLINRASLSILVLALLIDGASIIGGYYFWALSTWKIGQWIKQIDPTYGDLLVPIGFAYAPQVLNFFIVIPLLGRPIELVLSAWSLLAVIVAVRQGLDISTNRAALICLIGWPLIQIAIGFVQVLEQRLVAGI